MNCKNEKSLYADMPFCQGQKSTPGIRPFVLAARKADILKFPVPEAPTSLEDAAVIKEAFTFGAGEGVAKGFAKIDIVPSDANPSAETQGAFGSKSFKNTLPIHIPGTKEKATGFITVANNDDMVFIFFEKDGKARLHGDAGDICELALGQSHGATATDPAYTIVTSTVNSEYPHPFVASKIPLLDGTFIDGTTGEVTAE